MTPAELAATRATAARDLLDQALTLAVCAGGQETDAILDEIEDQIVRLRRARRRGLWEHVKIGERGKFGSEAWLRDEMRKAA